MSNRIKNRLSAAEVKSLLKPSAKPGRYADGDGLYLSVGLGNARRWVFLYRWHGRLREMGLGSAHTVTLAKAREFADAARKLRNEKKSPLEYRKAQQDIPLFGGFALELIDDWKSEWRNEKHIAQWSSSLQTHASKIWDMPVNAIETEDVLAVLKPIWKSRPETASRVRARIERVLDAASARGFRHDANPARWRHHLQRLLPRPAKLSRGHHAALPYGQVAEFYATLKLQESVASRALAFLILTAARTGEVLGATWSEIDLPNRQWEIPQHRMKGGRKHRVPLCDEAIVILKEVSDLTGREASAPVFPGRRGNPLSNMAMTQVLRRMGIPREAATVHGFRSTFRDWAGDVSSFPRETAEAALSHVVGDKTERAYARGDALEKRRAMMQAWAAFLSATATDNKVVAFSAVGGE